MASDEIPEREAELPVVARLVIEIRSDGSRTVARGALEQATAADAAAERVAVEARGGSPAALAVDLLRALMTMPFQASLARWTGREGQVAKASLVEGARPESGVGPALGPALGLAGRVRRELSGRLRRRLGLGR